MANRPTLTEIKMHSRIDTDYEDDYLVALDNSDRRTDLLHRADACL